MFSKPISTFVESSQQIKNNEIQHFQPVKKPQEGREKKILTEKLNQIFISGFSSWGALVEKHLLHKAMWRHHKVRQFFN